MGGRGKLLDQKIDDSSNKINDYYPKTVPLTTLLQFSFCIITVSGD